MIFKQPTISRVTRLYKALARRGVAESVLRGRVLWIDPSCGSQSSQPGYAVCAEGVLQDSGVVEMPITESLERRLYYLARCLRNEFPEKFDAVVVEDIPSHRFSKGRGGRVHANFRSQLSLHYACAVAVSSFDVDHVLRISPATWWSFAPEGYVKSDESDAVVMAHATLEIAKYVIERGSGRGRRKS